jgi:hypothetical protein
LDAAGRFWAKASPLLSDRRDRPTRERMSRCKVSAATALFSPAERAQRVAALADSDRITNLGSHHLD